MAKVCGDPRERDVNDAIRAAIVDNGDGLITTSLNLGFKPWYMEFDGTNAECGYEAYASMKRFLEAILGTAAAGPEQLRRQRWRKK